MPAKRLPPNVHPHGNGFRAIVQIDGHRHFGPVCRRPEQASAYAKQYRAGGGQGEAPTMLSAFAAVLENLQARSRSPASMRGYQASYKTLTQQWPPHTLLHAIRAEDVQAWVGSRVRVGLAPASIVKDLAVLGRMFSLQVRAGALLANPVLRVERPQIVQQRRDVLTPEEIRAHAATLRARGLERHARLLELAFLTGMRRSEFTRLRVDDIDLHGARIHVRGKTGARELPLTEEAVGLLRAAIAEPRGSGIFGTVDEVASAFARMREELGDVRLHAHALRHSFATALARANVSPYVLKDLLGHRSLQQGLTYYHSSGAASRAAVAALARRPAGPESGGDLPPASAPPCAPS